MDDRDEIIATLSLIIFVGVLITTIGFAIHMEGPHKVVVTECLE